MAKQAVWIVIFTFLFAQTSAWAGNPFSDNPKKPAAAKGPGDDPSYLSVKDAYKEPKAPSVGERVSALVSAAKQLMQSAVSATEPPTAGPKTDVSSSRPAAHPAVPQRGDPKTLYSQSENRYHSAKQLPPPPPVDPVPDPDPAPDPAPEPAPSLDLTTWDVVNTYQSGVYELSVYFKETEAGVFDYVLVIYDTQTGEAIEATGYRSTTVYEMPDLTGYTLVTTVSRSDDGWTEKYALFGEGPASWEDVSAWIEISYDSAGILQYATIKTVEQLTLETLAIPSLDSIVV